MPNARPARGLASSLAIASVLACGGEGRPGPGQPHGQATVPETSDAAGKSPMAVDTVSPRGAGSISIALSSDDDRELGEFITTLLMIDPTGRRTGHDAARGVTRTEIPNAWYEDEVIEDPLEEGSGMATRHLELTSPDPGTYTLSEDATERGRYDLSIRGCNTRLEPSGREFRRVEIGMSETHTYVVEFDSSSGITVTGPEP